MFDNLRMTTQAGDPSVGDRFISTDDRTYTEAGVKGVHHTEVMYEITELTDRGFEAKAVEVVAESGRPEFASTPRSTSMAWFGWDNGIAKGRIRLVTNA
jgi:hypothetical protein